MHEGVGLDAQGPIGRARPLHGSVAVVTGASSGIGLATARLLAGAGAMVHGVARRAEAMAEEIEAAGLSERFVPHGLDVTDAAGVDLLVREIGEREGIDVLICAAGTNIPRRRLEELSAEGWDELLAVNLSGAFYCLRVALPYLRRSRGCAILVGSVSGSWPDASGAGYQASKAGLQALARAAGLEEHAHGVRCSTVMPGMVETAILDKRPTPPPKEVREQMLRPEDVAAACLFLATLPSHAYIPELTMLPTALQALGDT